MAICALCALCAVGLILLWLRHVECVRDPEARELTVRWVRWPLPTKERVIAYDAIMNIAVERWESATYVVVVGLDGARISLRVASATDTAEVLRSWLGLRAS